MLISLVKVLRSPAIRKLFHITFIPRHSHLTMAASFSQVQILKIFQCEETKFKSSLNQMLTIFPLQTQSQILDSRQAISVTLQKPSEWDLSMCHRCTIPNSRVFPFCRPGVQFPKTGANWPCGHSSIIAWNLRLHHLL